MSIPSPFPVRLLEHVVPPRTPVNTRIPATLVDRLLKLDADQIRHLWDPWTCQPDELPYLAWALSVDIWDTTWNLNKKRAVVAAAFSDHKIKGTLDGIERYLDLVDVDVIKVVTPTTKMFSGPSLTREAREAWLRQLPQIRIFNEYSRGTADLRLFCGGSLKPRFREGRFPQPSDALKRLGPQCEYFLGDTPTTTKIVEISTNTYQMYIDTANHGSIFSGERPRAKKFFQPSSAQGRILTVTPVSASPWRTPVGPTLVPITSEPELVAREHPRNNAVITGTRPVAKRFLLPSMARFNLYQRFAIYDGTGPIKRPSIQFTGVGRYGYPVHSAELTLKFDDLTRDVRSAQFGGPVARQRFYVPHDDRPMLKAESAIVAAKRLSDKIVVRADATRGIIAGLPFYAGDEYLA